ncbi:MAG: ribosome maturation factor RimM [Candidatus Marinimicrobia bacterium]|nr:ribosome maturation factor RimM [Candidatus Neomarinimicrobiota bacterium]
MPFRIIGYVGKPIGLEGKFYISDPGLDAQALRSLKYVYLGNDKEPEEVFDVLDAGERGRRLSLLLNGINTREQAERFLHSAIFISDKQAENFTDEREDFRYKGYRVLQDGEELGTVSGRMQLPMQEVIVITAKNGKEILLPFVEEFIRTIDDKAGQLHVKLLEGMLDED